jgi:hypothetical protein
LTPDRALIYAILKGGIPAFNLVRRRGVKSDDLFGDDVEVFKVFEKFLPKGRMPTTEEISLLTKIAIPPHDGLIDPDICAESIAKRSLSKKLNDGVGKITDEIVTDPFKARAELGKLVHETVWSQGNVQSTNLPTSISEVEDRYLEAEKHEGGLLGLSSPWPSLDAASLGLQNGEVSVVFAKRKTGKTWAMLAWANHIWKNALKRGENILFISMEMPPWQINRRLFAINNKLDYALFREGKLPEDQRTRFLEWCKSQKEADTERPEVIVIGSDVVRTVPDLVGVVAQYRPRAVFVDGFYILGKDQKKQMWERTLENVQAIKLDAAVNLNLPFVISTQLSGQTGKHVMDADSDAAAYAKAIGDYADACYGIFADDMFRAAEKRLLRVMEAREFKPIDLQINFSQSRQDYSEIKVVTSKEDEALNDSGAIDTNLPDFEPDEQLSF